MIYAFGECELDSRLFELRRAGEAAAVEPQVFDMLAYLVRNRDRVVTRQEILDVIWAGRFVSETTLNSRIKAARKAVGDDGRAQRLIRTVHGRGFRFVGVVVERAAAGSEADPQSTHPALLFGRDAEMDQLRKRLAGALASERQMVFVTGESGMGKTTLVEAFLAEAVLQTPLAIGRGHCIEFRSAGEAYMPVLDALAGMASGPALKAELDRHAPSWLVQLPGLVDAADYDALRQRVAGTTRERMLRELAGALEAMASERPVVLVFEDLHWADHATLDLLAWLGRCREPARLLILGTYRPSDVRRTGHPLEAVQQELRIRGACVELGLRNLDAEAVRACVAARAGAGNSGAARLATRSGTGDAGAERLATSGSVSDSAAADPAARRISAAVAAGSIFDLPSAGSASVERLAAAAHARTEGNPLFVRAILDAGSDPLQEGVPDTLKLFIEQRLLRLPDADRDILEAASITGIDFTADTAAAAAGVPKERAEQCLADLARQELFVRSNGIFECPDGTAATRFTFVHGFYQEVLYDRILVSGKMRRHRDVGLCLESAYGPEASAHAAELAMHFVRGRDPERAVRYLRLSAEQDIRRSAHREAVEQMEEALTQLRRLPATPERGRQELALQAALAPALIATEGWSASGAEKAYRRACLLGRHLEESSTLSSTLFGLAVLSEYSGRHETARALIEERLRLTGEGADAAREIESCALLSSSNLHQGNFGEALIHADAGLAAYDASAHRTLLAVYGEEPAVTLHSSAALALALLGRSEEAVARIRAALEIAGRPDRRFSLAHAHMQAATQMQFLGDIPAVRDHAAAAVATAEAHGFPYRAAVGRILLGWAQIAGEDEGISLLRQGLAEHRATGAEMNRPYYLGLLADALYRSGRTDEAREALDEALAMIGDSRTFFYQPELRRLEGMLSDG